MVQSGDKVLVLPQNEFASVKGTSNNFEKKMAIKLKFINNWNYLTAISIDELPAQSAFAGDHVSLTLANYDIENINIGYILCEPSSPVPVTTRFEARIVVFNISVPITLGKEIIKNQNKNFDWLLISFLLQAILLFCTRSHSQSRL